VRRRLVDAGGALAASLSDRRLRRVQLAWSGTITAEWAVIVALAVWAFEAGGALGIGLVTLARTIPAAVIGPFLAPLADRFRRDRVLTVVTVVRVLLVGTIGAALMATTPMVVVYVVAALDATTYTLYWPAQSSLLAELAPRPEELVAANVASTTIENIGALGGPALAAALLGFADPGTTVATAALLLAVSVAVLLPLAWERRTEVAAAGEHPETVGGHLAGFGHLARMARPRLVAGLYLSHTLALGALTVLIAVLALDALRLGQSGVGVLTAAMGAGGIAGSLAALGLVGQPRLARTMVTGVLVWAIAMGLLGVAPHVALAIALLAATGVCNALVDVAALTLLQRLVPVHLLARVLGVVEGVWWGTLGVGGFLASVLADRFGVELALAAVGAALALLAVVLHRAMGAVDLAVTVPRERLDALLRDPILGPLPTAELERLASAAVTVTAAPGDVIVRLGDLGDRYYSIASGVVEVTRPDLERRLGPEDGFGEIALLRNVTRTATVTAVEPTVLVAVERAAFLEAVRGHSRSGATADALVDERSGGRGRAGTA
jgi:MFS family permease